MQKPPEPELICQPLIRQTGFSTPPQGWFVTPLFTALKPEFPLMSIGAWGVAAMAGPAPRPAIPTMVATIVAITIHRFIASSPFGCSDLCCGEDRDHGGVRCARQPVPGRRPQPGTGSALPI